MGRRGGSGSDPHGPEDPSREESMKEDVLGPEPLISEEERNTSA
jgi:hypothetical protein